MADFSAMNTAFAWPTDFSHVSDETLERAQRAYEEFYPKCFWSMPRNLKVTRGLIRSIIEELKLNGGHKGYQRAAELCR